jgi:hypothetical protein
VSGASSSEGAGPSLGSEEEEAATTAAMEPPSPLQPPQQPLRPAVIGGKEEAEQEEAEEEEEEEGGEGEEEAAQRKNASSTRVAYAKERQMSPPNFFPWEDQVRCWGLGFGGRGGGWKGCVREREILAGDRGFHFGRSTFVSSLFP